MLQLRPYQPEDADAITAWFRDEYAFRQWCADRFETYPLTREALNTHYAAHTQGGAFFPMTAYDAQGVQGHLILRFTDAEKKRIRFGFVIVNPEKRGQGYGKKLLSLAIRHATEELKASHISLGVFENNPSAFHCYRAVGFRTVTLPQPEHYTVLGETWNCIEMEYLP